MNVRGLYTLILILVAALSSTSAQTNDPPPTEFIFLSPPKLTNSATPKELGDRYYDAAQYADALKKYRQILAGKPSDDEALWRAANCCFALNNFAEAKILYDQYARLRPDVGEVHFWMGGSFERLGQIKAAEKEFRKSIDLAPTFGRAYDALVHLLINQGRCKAAIPFAETAIDLEGESEESGMYLATSLITIGDYSKATNILRRFIQRYPQNADGYFWMGQACYKLRDYARAETCFEQALQRKPDDFSWQTDLANALYQQHFYLAAGLLVAPLLCS